mgnify:CR=1 FL=1
MSTRPKRSVAPRARKPALEVKGALWLSVDGQPLGERGRLGLLRAIAEQGSITQGAKAYGLSYKAAWDAVDAMNNQADEALVARVTGGRHGGGTRLTDYGKRVLTLVRAIEGEYQRMLGLLAEDDDAEPLGLFLPGAVLVLVVPVHGDRELGDGLPVRRVAHLGIAPEVAHQNHLVHAAHRRLVPSAYGFCDSSSCSRCCATVAATLSA